jgi:hypothetical protein
MGPLPLKEKGNKYVISCEDQMPKEPIAIPITNQEAEQ